MGWFVQVYRSREVAWPQCWFPTTLAVGLSDMLSDHCGDRNQIQGGHTLVVEMIGPVIVDEHAIGVVHETDRRAEVDLWTQVASIVTR
jgi:hypothetical protein